MEVTLTVIEGPHQGRTFTFNQHETFIVGRSPNAHFRLSLKDKYFSRHHFMIEVNPPSCRLMDMASTNGTLVNRRKVTTIDLRDGDVIRGGRTVIRVAILAGDPDLAGTMPPSDGPGIGPATGPQASLPVVPGYRVERELGRGGMGVVYLARREADGAALAIKTIIPAAAGTSVAVARFLREAGVLRTLKHPGIVRFEEIGHHDGRLFFAMEYVPGIDARRLVQESGGPLPIGEAVGLACRALEALAHAHGRGFVHRDVKPQNLLVARTGGRVEVKVVDFGLARIYHDSPLSGLTLTNQVAGTTGFMAPEQITNFREARPPVDQYALGATLYYLLTGRKVYDFPPRVEQQLLMILQDDPVPIRSRRADLPEELAEIVHRSLARSPAERFPDVAAMRAALKRFESGNGH